MWYSVCGLDREQCGTVYEDWTREECGRVYVNWTGNSVVQCMWTGQGTVWYSV